MRVLIAPDSFKDCLPAAAVAEAMAIGVTRAAHEARIDLAPMADGGQGTLDTLVRAANGVFREITVTGPLGAPVTARLGLIDEARTAIVEMAQASGLELVPIEQRNPLRTTTFGTGELIRAALDAHVNRILVAIGGSATNDGGIGMAQALGYQFRDEQGEELPLGANGLNRLARIDSAKRDTRLDHVFIDVACDVSNPLTGPDGASAVYGPQKGATPAMIAQLDDGLTRMADIVKRDLGTEIQSLVGGGAAGGLGAGLVAFANAKLEKGVKLVMEAVRLRERMKDADLCLTGEGSLDFQSSFGKTAVGVAQLGQELGVPVVILAGSVGPGAAACLEQGATSYFSICPRPMLRDEALSRAADNLAQSAENVVRLFLRARRSI